FSLAVGSVASNFLAEASATLAGVESQGRLAAILQTSIYLFSRLSETAIRIGDILSGIWVAALPVARQFIDALDTMIERWQDLVRGGLEDGTLAATLQIWYDRSVVLFRALGNVAGALWDILAIGADSSDSVFTRFDEWAERY